MDTRGYFTFADKITQDRMSDRSLGERKKRVERNLKASLLLNNEVIFRAYSVIESDITETILRDNAYLLEKGILIPECREQDELLLKQLDSYLSKSKRGKAILRKLEMAELIDNLPCKKEVDASRLSYSRSKCLALLLYRLAIAPNDHFKRGVKCSDLEIIFEKLFNRGIPPRGAFLDDIKQLFRKRLDAVNLVQSIYFGVGAHFTESNPIWTKEINPHRRENLRIWLSKQPVLKELSGENLEIAKRFGITDFLEENENDIAYLNNILSFNQRSENIVNSLKISSDDLDMLSFHDVLEIRNERQYADFQAYLKENITENDFGVSREKFVAEKTKYENRRKATETICTVLGFVPLIGKFFHLLPATLELFLSKKTKTTLSKNLPLFSYSEAVNEFIDTKLSA